MVRNIFNAVRTFRALCKVPTVFADDTRGNVLVLTGLLAVPLMLLAGAAVDMSQAISVRTKLSQAVDAAALGVAASGVSDPSAAQEIAQNIFNANYPANELGAPGSISLTFGEGSVSVDANATVDTTFLGVIGIGSQKVGSAAEVVWGANTIEVVMVLDNTGSMAGEKISDLKTAASALVDVLFADEKTASNVKIGLVPFATSVNIGTNAALQGWIDVNGQSELNELNFDAGTNIYDLYDDLNALGEPWMGCVQARIPPFDTDDTPPTTGNPETRWVPYLWPDEPDSFEQNVPFSYDNNYLDDLSNGSTDERQRNRAKYSEAVFIDADNRGPNWNCPNEVIPLTNNRSVIDGAIDAMEAKGTTNTATGLAWGMRVISSAEPFSQGAPYDDEETIKIVILLTDGKNFIGHRPHHNMSLFSSYDYTIHKRLGTASANGAVNKLDAKTIEVCDEIKSNDVSLYTIAFDIDSQSVKRLMEDCATTPEMYFDSPSGDELVNTFGVIAKQITTLRLSK